MTPSQDGWNPTLAGFWNRMIFTPEWVCPRLFPGPQIETHFALFPLLPLIYRDEQVVMEISALRLVFRPRILDDDVSLLRAETMARTALTALPETPVQAVGINFAFRESIPPGHVLAMFNDA